MIAQLLNLGIVSSSRTFSVIRGSGRTIEFTNPANTHKVWRGESEYTGTITQPLGYNVPTWKIINHKTLKTVVSGTSNTVTWKPEYLSGSNCYDIVVTTSHSLYPTVERIFPAEMSVLPPVFSRSDAHIIYNLASGGMGSKDGQWTDRSAISAYNNGTTYASGNEVKYNGKYYRSLQGSNLNHSPDSSSLWWKRIYGYMIWVENSATGTTTNVSSSFNPYYWRSEDETFPVHFIFADASIYSAAKIFSPGPSKNTIYDGCYDENIQYGFRLKKKPYSPDGLECLVFDSVDQTGGGGQPTRRSYRVTICGISIDNLTPLSGGTGFQITTRNTAENNYDNYVLDQFVAFNITTKNNRNEGYYLYHFSDALVAAPDAVNRSYAPGTNNLFYRLSSRDTGNEGIQFSSMIDSEVFLCDFRNAGTRNQTDHRNGFQFGGGNIRTVFYMNYIEVSKNIFNGSTGRHGKDVECFSNLMYSTGKNAVDGVNFQHVLEQNVDVSTIYWRFKNNTIIILGTGFTQTPFSLYRSATTTLHDKLYIDGNMIISNTLTETEYPGAWSPGAQLSTDNQQYTNINTPLFFNVTNKNFKLGSLSSPAFRDRTIVAGLHRMINYDYEGVKFLDDVDGCYSGYELVTGSEILRTIQSVGSLSNVTNVPGGLAFTALTATYLPTSVIVTNTDTTSRSVSVVWSQGSYNPAVPNTYNLTGTLSSLPSDIINPSLLTASISVQTNSAAAALDLKINLGSSATKVTSSTSLDLSTLPPTFSMTVASGLNYTPNQNLRIFSRVTPTAAYIDCQVSAYTSTTLALKNRTVVGNAIRNDWDIDLAGWASVGTTNPYPGSYTTRDFGQIVLHGVNTGIGIRALNTGVGSVWNNTFATGVDTNANSGVMPDDVLLSGWFCDLVAQPAIFELYDFGGGTTLADGAIRIRATGSRAATGPRTVAFQVNSMSEQNIDAANNSASRVEFTNVSTTGGVVQVKIRSTTPNGGGTFGYINGVEIFR